MIDIKTWFQLNKKDLEYLYYKLIYISKAYGINIINNQSSIDEFICMMYNLSDKYIYDENYIEI